MPTFDALILSLPTRSSTMRMRVWRALKESGCAMLRDGVYILPADSPRSAVLAGMGAQVKSAGGFAMTARLSVDEDLAGLFDRSADYGKLVQEVRKLGPPTAQGKLQRLQRAFERLAQIDFFPGQAQRQAAEAFAALKRDVEDVSGEPRPSRARPARLDRAKYQKRVWATRKDPWVDRLASAWLIKRFIDRDARFVWIGRPRERPKGAIGFDFDGAQFTHADNRVTFEVLLASFGLGNDPALLQIGAAVHFLDVGGIPVPDAKGLETVLTGIKEKARGDDALLADAMRILDLFYSAYERNGPRTSKVMPVPSLPGPR
jgi:hypothetical protein